MISSAEIRQTFLDYFQQRGHPVVPSASLVPVSDPSLLFTNAGMVPFKDVFLGRESRDYARAASSQRCVRAGGKHNDLENVGYTARHHTFFEMLGNFSFGDYFKREAIHYAWELLTTVFELPADRLWITVYTDDDEAARIWLDEIGIAPERFGRIGAEDNFWSMGDTGPCGPCSEIFYDHGPALSGGPPGTPEADGDRYVEIWNLVFMQYDRDRHGTLHPLPKPSVDTGMGLERLAAVLQGVHSNYDIDLFRHLIEAAAQATGIDTPAAERPDEVVSSLKVIADHIRSCSFLVLDGVLPSNDGRGYVLRRIIRRAARHGHRLGCDWPFFHTLVPALIAEMGSGYPDLAASGERIAKILRLEEERFAETLSQGIEILTHWLDDHQAIETVPGDLVFKLYDTYGFPVDLTADVARERGRVIDFDGFERAMEQQRARARAASQFAVDYGAEETLDVTCHFTGYDTLTTEDTAILAVLRSGQPVDRLDPGDQGAVVLAKTPFYAESGGQVGDRGELRAPGVRFEVTDTQRTGGAIAHYGLVRAGHLQPGEAVEARVDPGHRQHTALNHSATHLVHAALREVLGGHVQQKGSLVTPDRLRFDFAHFEPITTEQLERIEQRVNDEIRANRPAEIRTMALQEALAEGALALFGEKYGEQVRVLRFGDFSIELCGGTHVARTGDIGGLKIVTEAGVSAGVRRIEAITGPATVAWMQRQDRLIDGLAERLKSAPEQIEERVEQLLAEQRHREKELEQLKSKLTQQAGQDLEDTAQEIAGIRLVAARLDGADPKTLRATVDRLKERFTDGAIVLGSVDHGKVRLIAGVTDPLKDRLPAGELVNHVAQQVGGKGGGRADMAQAGGNAPEALDGALASVRAWVASRVAAD